MPAIDWTSPGFVVALGAAGAVLIVLGILFYFLPAARIKGLALLVGIGGGLAAGTALGLYLVRSALPVSSTAPSADSPTPDASTPVSAAASRTEGMERFRKATPAQRMAQVRRLPDASTAWYTVTRGDVSTITGRGSLESADNAEVVVQVHAPKPGLPAATIRKVLVEDGAMVRKDQLLVELDDTELQERLKIQKGVVEEKKTELAQVQRQAELDTERAQLDLEEAQHQLTFVERDFRMHPGGDAEQKKGKELKVKEARQLVKTREFQITTTKTRTEAARRAAQASLDSEMAHLKELESDIAHCKLTAPRDGQVIYHIPERWRASGPPLLVAEGEAVREGQKLLYLPDLSKMQVRMLIHESQIAHVRSGQTARVRVDAFPNRTLTAKVESIAKSGEVLMNVRVYPVTIALPDEKLGLKPGMSAEVRIQVEPHRHVLRVPVQALVVEGRQRFCFVQAGNEIEERPVVVGLSDDGFVEITSGLRAGEQVLRDPRAVASR